MALDDDSGRANLRFDVPDSFDAAAPLAAFKMFQATLSALPDPVFVINRQRRCLYASEAAMRVLDRPATAFIGKTLWEMGVPSELATDLAAQTEQVFRTGRSAAGANVISTLAGPRWYDHLYSPIHDERGEVMAMLYIAKDVTERKQAEEALRLTTERFGLALQGSGIVVFNQDLDLRYTWIYNPALGYTAEQTIGKRDSDLFERTEDAAATEALKREVIRTGIRHRQEVKICAAGVEHYYDLLVDPLRDHTGLIVGITCAAIDITERKRSELSLRMSEERFRIAENASHSFVYDWNISTDFEERSEGFTTLLGYTNAEVPYGGTAWERLIHPDDLARVRLTTETALTSDPPMASVEYRVLHKNDHWIWVIDEFAVVRDNRGVVQRIVGSIVDISLQKRQQQEIADLNARLQRSVTESHHRIKNNLQVLNAMVDMQIADGRETVAASEFKRVGQHIRTLATVHDLLTVESKVSTDREMISLRTTLQKIIPMLQVATGGREVTLRADEMMVSLKQAGACALLVNELVSNALKHGQGNVEITLALISDPTPAINAEIRRARLEVCDDGPGFPANFDPKIAANTGLELIDSLGRWDLRGEVAYENRVEGGARVFVIFPIPAMVL